MDWLIPALLSLAMYGLWGFLPKLATDNLDPRSAWLFEMFGFAMSTLVIAIALGFRMHFQPRGALLAFAMGIAGALGTLFFFYAAHRYKASIVTLVIALYPLLSIFLAVIFLQETMTPKQWLGVILGMISLFCLTG